MTRPRLTALALALSLALSRVSRGEAGGEAALAHVDAILHAKQQADAQVTLLNTQLALALDDADTRDKAWADKVKASDLRADNAAAAYAAIEGGWPYLIGDVIVRFFRVWLTCFLVAFAVRMICSLPWFVAGPLAPLASIGALVSTCALHVLTLGMTLATNVPDNLYFLTKIRAIKEQRRLAQEAAYAKGASPAEVAGQVSLAAPGVPQ